MTVLAPLQPSVVVLSEHCWCFLFCSCQVVVVDFKKYKHTGDFSLGRTILRCSRPFSTEDNLQWTESFLNVHWLYLQLKIPEPVIVCIRPNFGQRPDELISIHQCFLPPNNICKLSIKHHFCHIHLSDLHFFSLNLLFCLSVCMKWSLTLKHRRPAETSSNLCRSLFLLAASRSVSAV